MTPDPFPPSAPEATWSADHVRTRDGQSIPVRGTARRPRWADLPIAVRAEIETAAGSAVEDTWSAGTGFTPGFASRLDLADGRRLFVKAASSADDRRHGWQISEAYREEIRKLAVLPPGIPAPPLLWSIQTDLAGEDWVKLGLAYIDGRPPRRPWSMTELDLVTEALTSMAPLMAEPPAGLRLGSFSDDFGGWARWLELVVRRDGPSSWLDRVTALANDSVELCSGIGMAHLDLRDDNILIDRQQRVWICDWNFPMRAAPWVDLVCVLLAARGDGLDVDSVLATHPLSRDVDARSIDALLANLWLYFTTRMEDPVPEFSPHLRDHQRWYAEVTEDWLRQRLPAHPSTGRRTPTP
jgi:hypothetical protein